ncbi:MAG: NADH-quinone oxidoreductase subunit J [Syntrophobacterales bacterium]|nr:NADH-quinone oxidoreductase subunit J [Syntrophobacterales bacterium]
MMGAISFKLIVFFVAALVVIVSSLLMTTRKNPIHSALWMILTFFAMAVIYLLLNAQFIAVAQVMVYAGAIMMLILFVIMMVSLDNGAQSEQKKISMNFTKKAAWSLAVIILLLELIFGALFYQTTAKIGSYPAEAVTSLGNAKTVGTLLYGQYLFPFEIASILLLVGIIGAVVLSRKSK